MKRIITAVVVFLSIIAFCLLSNRYILSQTDYILDLLTPITEESLNKNPSATLENLTKASAHWTAVAPVLSTFLRHTELDGITVCFSKTMALLEAKSHDPFLGEYAQLQQLLEALAESTQLSLRNIF